MSESIAQESMEARRGADDVQARFETILHVGSPSISDLAYAIKSRVKDDFKIEEKVRKKRAEDKPDYKTKDIRDIVGVRVVTLYRLDALDIIPRLIRAIDENSGADETEFFLSNPIEEVKIYSVDPLGDAQNLAHRIRDVFGLSGVGERCSIETKQGNYSSVHIVVWARGKYGKSYREVPVEIQVRTALEDVWSENGSSVEVQEASSRGDRHIICSYAGKLPSPLKRS